ncbi:MAG: MFS transporter [Alphaproteobacteria bacterium]|nr:MFS transporter [Alphaproteobacteria bacterium]
MTASRRASVAFVIAVVYIDMLGLGLAFPILPRLVEQLMGGNISNAAYVVGWLSSGYALMQFLLSPALGALSDSYGRRPVILLGLLGMGANYFLLAFAPTLVWFAAARLISGATGATYTTAAAYLADITPPEKRAANFGLIGAAFGFGFITGPVLGGLLGAVDLHLPFLAAGVLSLANVALGWFILPESLGAALRKPFSWTRANPVGALKEMGRYSSVLGLIVIYLLAMFANRVAEMTWVLYAAYRFHWGPTETGISLAMVGVMFVVGQGVMPRLLVPKLGERRAVMIGLAVSVVVLVLYGTVPQGWMIYPVMALGCFGWVMGAPALMSLLSREVAADEQGLLQGALASVQGLTSIAGPPIWTGLFGYFVSPAAPVIVPGAAFFAAAAVFAVALGLAGRWVGWRDFQSAAI